VLGNVFTQPRVRGIPLGREGVPSPPGQFLQAALPVRLKCSALLRIPCYRDPLSKFDALEDGALRDSRIPILFGVPAQRFKCFFPSGGSCLPHPAARLCGSSPSSTLRPSRAAHTGDHPPDPQRTRGMFPAGFHTFGTNSRHRRPTGVRGETLPGYAPTPQRSANLCLYGFQKVWSARSFAHC
jgi:hypothetical protein